MFRKHLFLSVTVAGLAIAAPAGASSDFASEPSWKLVNRDFTGGANMALVSPGNDTRVNMILLISDRNGGAQAKGPVPYVQSQFGYWALRDLLFPPPNEEARYYRAGGSRCDSNEQGRDAFIEAAKAEKRLSDEERSTLIGLRETIQVNGCDMSDGSASAQALSSSNPITSAIGKAFQSYLEGATAFYDGDFNGANARFAAITNADNGWVSESATYMLGRVAINQATETAFGEWGDFDEDKTDKGAVETAGQALTAYMAAYPKGRYVGSAKGLMRRVHWLAGEDNALASDYTNLIATPGQMNAADIAEEIDLKLLPQMTGKTAADPLILATIDLKRMRDPNSLYGDDLMDKTISLAELQGQRSLFANNPSLFDYLLATHQFYVGNNAKEVLKLIPDAAKNPNFSYLDFSRQMLRGLALEAVADRNARGFWLEMIGGAKQPMQRQAVELAIALHDERAGNVNLVFAPQSQVRDPAIREILLTSAAGPDLLRAQASNAQVAKREREIALYTLLYKSLTRGAYRDFVSDVKLVPPNASNEGPYWGIDYWASSNSEELSPVPVGQFVTGKTSDGYACPKISETALTLSLNPKQSRGQLCLGDFLRLNGFDNYWMDSVREADQLGGSKSQFPGTYQPRQAIYQRLIADPTVAGEDKAYALYRAVWCYGPSGYNSCGGEDVAQSVRKGWYDRLKRDYPASKWAKSLKYYW